MSLLDKIREKIRGEKKQSSSQLIGFDPEKHEPVIRSSICTGEKVAGFKSKEDGHFTEVMVLRTMKDEERFKEMYHLDSVKTEY